MYTVLVTVLIWSLFAEASQCFEKRTFSQSLQSLGPVFDSSANQVCGYVTADINNALACYDGQYCTTISGFFGCCSNVSATLLPYTNTRSWTYTLTPTADETTTTSYTVSGTSTSYSYQSCGIYTRCYGSSSAGTFCTGPCANNTENLLCTGSQFPYCQTLTMAHESPNTTYTAFWCAEVQYDSFLPLYVNAEETPINTAQTATSYTSSSYSPTAYTPTSITQSSKPAAAANTITVAPIPINNASPHPLPHVKWVLPALLLNI